ncbi:MAG: histidinol-phosphate transaminase [Oscillospiraceae bacterium]
MAYQLTPKLRNLTPYQPITGEFKIRLDANESYMNLPDYLKEKVSQAVSQLEFNRYPDPYCTRLCKIYAEYYKINSELVTAGNGSDELIALLMNSFFEKGDKILTLAPDFSMYGFYISLAELEQMVFDKGSDLHPKIDEVIYYINTNNIAGIIFSNPCNPTSMGVTTEDIIKLIKNVNCLVILDEAYMDFWDSSILGRVSEFDNLIILRTCSKAFGLAAIRLGFAVANKTLTNAIRAAKSPYNVNSMTQTVAEVVLSDQSYLQECIKQLKQARESLYESFVKLQSRKSAITKVYKPQTNFVFIKTTDNKAVFDGLSQRGIAIRFMGEFLRITAGSQDENNAVLQALEEIL